MHDYIYERESHICKLHGLRDPRLAATVVSKPISTSEMVDST